MGRPGYRDSVSTNRTLGNGAGISGVHDAVQKGVNVYKPNHQRWRDGCSASTTPVTAV